MYDIEHLLREYKSDTPVRVEALIRNLGVVLEPAADLEGGISGNIQRQSDGTYIIRTNKSEHEYRRRFTMAHELGHYVLHRSILDLAGGANDSTMYRTDRNATLYNSHIHMAHEKQANSFAANLLMPDDNVYQVWLEESEKSSHSNKLPELRSMYRRFHVSPSAMRWKLKNMGLDFIE